MRTDFDENVVVLKIFPGIGKLVFENILNIPGLKGVVLESFGSGNIPTTRWMISQIKNAIKRKIIFLNVTQCQGGAVNMGRYETGVELENAGVVSGKDMTHRSRHYQADVPFGAGFGSGRNQAAPE